MAYSFNNIMCFKRNGCTTTALHAREHVEVHIYLLKSDFSPFESLGENSTTSEAVAYKQVCQALFLLLVLSQLVHSRTTFERLHA